MFNSILVPVTLGADATPVLARAKSLLAPEGQVTVVHVVEAIPEFINISLPPNLADAGKRKALAELSKKVADFEGFDAKIIDGHAGRAIVAEADVQKADCIVMASHVPGGLTDILIGSTAAFVVRHAKCSVMVMR